MRTAEPATAGDEPAAGTGAYSVAPECPAFQIPYAWINLLAILTDAAIIIIASVGSGIAYHEIAWGGSTGPIEIFIAVGCLMSVNFCGVSAACGSYRPENLIAFRRQVGDVLACWSLVGFALLTVAFLLKTTETFSRGATITFFITGLSLIIAWRAVVSRYLLKALELNVFGGERVIVISEGGPGQSGHQLTRNGYRPVRMLSIGSAQDEGSFAAERLQQLVIEVIKISRMERVFGVVLELSWHRPDTIDAIVEALGEAPVWIRLLPDGNVARYSQKRIALPGQGGMWLTEIKQGQLSVGARAAKRILDVIVAGLALLLLAPLLLLVAVLVKLDSSGPVLFRQTRTGLNGVPFDILKYRTMSVLENGDVVRQATERDPRITRIGSLLRKSSIDELPQLINVLKGEMSLVGPRPHAVPHNMMFEAFVANYAARYQMKPGITGWAQINGFRGENRTAETILRRVELDLLYVKNWSFWLDLWILAQTPFAVIGQKSAY